MSPTLMAPWTCSSEDQSLFWHGRPLLMLVWWLLLKIVSGWINLWVAKGRWLDVWAGLEWLISSLLLGCANSITSNKPMGLRSSTVARVSDLKPLKKFAIRFSFPNPLIALVLSKEGECFFIVLWSRIHGCHCKGVWLRRLLSDKTGEDAQLVNIYVDN